MSRIALAESRELAVLSHEVGLACQAEDVSLLAYDLRNDDTLGSGAVGALGNDKLAFLTDDILGTREVALGFDQSILDVHHACARSSCGASLHQQLLISIVLYRFFVIYSIRLNRAGTPGIPTRCPAVGYSKPARPAARQLRLPAPRTQTAATTSATAASSASTQPSRPS